MKTILYGIAVAAGLFIGICIAALTAEPVDDECKYCDEAMNTYTDKDGKPHSVCEICCFNPKNRSEKDSQK